MLPKDNESKTYKELLTKINVFLNKNFTDVTDKELEKDLYDILNINNISNPIVIVEIPQTENYCRIRNEYNYKEDYNKKINLI